MRRFLSVLILSLAVIGFSGLQAQELIWGGAGDPDSEFEGGLNGWQAIGISSSNPDSAENALWVWKANAQADSGTFWGARGPIESPSAANGAAVFDSDYLDNLGNAQNPDGSLNNDAFGTGPCPSPHRGELISPVIDCSDATTVALQFNQYYRNFQSTVFVGVSNDDGQTWTDIQVNDDIAVNASTDPGDVMLMDITNLAAGSDQVRIRFAFDGDYYFWIVDDVVLQTLPESNLALGDTLFYPPASQYQPLCFADIDTMGFSGEIRNIGGLTQTNVTLKAEILDEFGELIWADSTVIDSLETGLPDSTLEIEELFVPDMLDVGQYFIRYSVYTPDADDFNANDNVETIPFFMTDDLWSKEDGPVPTSLRPGGGPVDYDAGNVYQTSPNCETTFAFDGLQFVVAANSADLPLEGKEVEFYWLRVSDDVASDYSNFDVQADFKTGDNPQLDIVGYAIYEFTADDANFDVIDVSADIFVDWFTFDTLDMLTFDPGARYFLMASYVGSNNVLFHGVAQDLQYFQISSILFNDQWFLGGFGAGEAFVLRSFLSIIDNVDAEPLPENSVKLFPNPARDYINVKLELEESANTTFVIADLNGRVLKVRDYDNVMNENFQFNTSDLPAGTYMLRVDSEIGTKTKRFVIVK